MRSRILSTVRSLASPQMRDLGSFSSEGLHTYAHTFIMKTRTRHQRDQRADGVDYAWNHLSVARNTAARLPAPGSRCHRPPSLNSLRGTVLNAVAKEVFFALFFPLLFFSIHLLIHVFLMCLAFFHSLLRRQEKGIKS